MSSLLPPPLIIPVLYIIHCAPTCLRTHCSRTSHGCGYGSVPLSWPRKMKKKKNRSKKETGNEIPLIFSFTQTVFFFYFLFIIIIFTFFFSAFRKRNAAVRKTFLNYSRPVCSIYIYGPPGLFFISPGFFFATVYP